MLHQSRHEIGSAGSRSTPQGGDRLIIEGVATVELFLIVVALVRGGAEARRIESGSAHLRRRREAANVDLVRQLRGSEPLLKIEGRLPTRLPLLGRNDDHAVGSAGPVNGAGRRPFQDLNALDVVWVDVRSAVDRLVLCRGELQQVS